MPIDLCSLCTTATGGFVLVRSLTLTPQHLAASAAHCLPHPLTCAGLILGDCYGQLVAIYYPF